MLVDTASFRLAGFMPMLSTFCGASVMQARGLEMAGRMKIPLCVESSMEEKEGTWIVDRNVDEAVFIRSVASDENLAVLTVGGGRGSERMLVDALSREGIRTTAITAGGGLSIHIDGARLADAVATTPSRGDLMAFFIFMASR